MKESYVDRFEIFCAWYDWWEANGGIHYYGWSGTNIIEGLKTDPQKIINKGRIAGWWKR
jgi:hypothetical protein